MPTVDCCGTCEFRRGIRFSTIWALPAVSTGSLLPLFSVENAMIRPTMATATTAEATSLNRVL
jgi:hypothetical protein